MKTIKLTTMVIASYILSSTPFIIGQLIAVFGPMHLGVKWGKLTKIFKIRKWNYFLNANDI